MKPNAEVPHGVPRLILKLIHSYFALSRGMTMGVRAACFDDRGRIFLVRHSYVPGWYMPGGGIERGETARGALVKELREEGNLEILGEPQMIHVYYNRSASKRDHVIFYRVNVRQSAERLPDHEIVECGFFDLDALPEGTTAATRRRLRDLQAGVRPDDIW